VTLSSTEHHQRPTTGDSTALSRRILRWRDRIIAHPRLEWARARAAGPTAVVIVLASAAITLAIMHGTIWYSDEFRYGLNYRGTTHDIFKEEFGFIFPLTRIAYNGLFRLFGLRTYLPFRVFGVGCTIVLATSVGLYARRFANRWAGVVCVAYFMLLGSSFHNLLWPAASINELGVAMLPLGLVILSSQRRYATVMAFVLFGLGFGFAGPQAVAPIFGCLVFLAVTRRWRATLIPIAWFIYYLVLVSLSDYDAPAPITTNIFNAPGFIYRSAIGSTSGAMGLEGSAGPVTFAIFVVALVVGYHRLPRERRHRVLAAIAMTVTFWSITAVLRGHLNEPAAPRYLVFPITGYVLVLVELSTLVVWSSRRRMLAAGLIAFAVVANGSLLILSGRAFRYQSGVQRAELAALELAADRADASYQPDPSTMPYISAGPYEAAITALGSPAFSYAHLPNATESEREAADRVLLELRSIVATAVDAQPPGEQYTRCETHGGAAFAMQIESSDSPIYIENRGVLPIEIKARRFAAIPSTAGITTVYPGRRMLIMAAPDKSTTPWTLSAVGDVWTLCGSESS